MRVGIGFDVHPFAEGESLIIGGKEIHSDYGLKGHSDADVLTHALMDALLGAMGKGDIGRYFPDTDEKYRDISSLLLLKEIYELLTDSGYKINNIDLIVLAETPRITPHYVDIVKNYSQLLNLSSSKINIKATTTEKLGFIGRKEGMAAQAIVSIVEFQEG